MEKGNATRSRDLLLNIPVFSRHRICVFRIASFVVIPLIIIVSASFPILLLSQGLSPQKLLTQYALRSWSTDEGSPSTAVLDILQTRDKYIWLATFNGLARFDGVRFTAFNRSTVPAIESAGFYCLCEDSTGTLWAGSTSGNGLLRFSQGRFATYTQRDSLASGTIHALLFVANPSTSNGMFGARSQNGILWIGTAAGLQKATLLPNSSINTIETIPSLAGIPIWALHQDTKGTIWVGTRGKGVFSIATNGSVTSIPSTITENTIAVSFTSGVGDTLWVAGLERGLSFIVGNTLQPFTGSKARNIQKSVARKVYCDQHKTLWIGTVNDKLVRYRNGIVDMVTEGNKLTNIEAIQEDIEGNLWIGTYYTALSCLSDGKFTNYTTTEGLSNPIVHHIYEDHDGSIWIGTNKGLNHLRFSATGSPIIQQFTADNGALPNNTVRNILRDRRGRLWIATFGGLVCRDGNRSTTYTTNEGLTYNEVRLLFEDRDGNIWAGTRKGLNLLTEHNGKITFTTYTRGSNGLISDYFLSISQDRYGTMWFGTDGGGAIAFRNGAFQSFTTSEGLPANVVFQVYEDSKGILWFATVNGLVRYDADAHRNIFSTIDHRQGLPSTVIFDILEDNKGFFWLTTPDGALAINREELRRCADGTLQHLLYSHYTKADGMSATECTGASKGLSSGNTIWLPTLNGVCVVNSRKIWNNKIAPAVYVERVIADGRVFALYDSLWNQANSQTKVDIENTQILRLPAGTRSLELEYTGLSMSTPSKTSFRYVLEGFDSTWVDVGSRRKAFYTNLPPRLYRFRVLACNNDGVWSPLGAALLMRIEPFFFQTWWFLVCCVVFGCGILYIGYRWRIYSLQQQQRKLQAIVDERTSQIRSQNEEILRQQAVSDEQSRNIEIANSEIEERNAQLQAANLDLKELDELKNEVIRIVAHDLKNPLSSIILASSLIESYAERMTPAEVTDQVRKIRVVGERMSDIITDLLRIDALESGKIRLTMEICSLNPLVRAAVDEMRNQADQKNIQLVFSDEGSSCYALIDERVFRQVIDNLLSNAIKYSPLHTRAVISLIAEAQFVRLEVQDEGPGISPEDMQKLFGKFTRLSALPTGGENSTGLGLSIVKRLVEAMNGKVWCESELGKGSTFIVELPKAAE